MSVRIDSYVTSTPPISLETCFVVDLYAVEIVGGSMELLDHDDVQWVSPSWAMQRMACSPAFYLHYEGIASWAAARGHQP